MIKISAVFCYRFFIVPMLERGNDKKRLVNSLALAMI